MKQNLTYIAVLLDRSGSMTGSVDDVIGGVNTFIGQQRKVDGEALLTIARFDTEYETIYEDVDIKAARGLTGHDFVPRGSTALLDSMSRLIDHVGAKLSAMSEPERPGQVIFLVFTDGAENASQEVRDPAIIRAKVELQTKTYGWKFLFFGADMNAFAAGATIGVKGISSSKASGGILRSAQAASAYVGYSRRGDAKSADAVFGAQHVDDKDVVDSIAKFKREMDEAEPDDNDN